MTSLASDDKLRSLDFNIQIKEMGFETFNPVTNMGGLFTLVWAVIFEFMLVGVISLAVKRFKIYRSRRNA